MCGHLPIKQASASITLASTSLAKASQHGQAQRPCGRWTGVGKWGELGGEAYLGCE